MQTQSRFVIAVEPRSIRLSSVESGRAASEAEALRMVEAQLAQARRGECVVSALETKALYKVYAYVEDDDGSPDKLITQRLVRELN